MGAPAFGDCLACLPESTCHAKVKNDRSQQSAGSDPSGGRGNSGLLKTIDRIRVYAKRAITLITVQNTGFAVDRVELLAAELVADQIRAVVETSTGRAPRPEPWKIADY